MAETVDEATIIAWVDGELDEPTAARTAEAVAADPVSYTHLTLPTIRLTCRYRWSPDH